MEKDCVVGVSNHISFVEYVLDLVGILSGRVKAGCPSSLMDDSFVFVARKS